MKSKYRMLGLVACLLVVWMVTRGTNGCAMPPPDERNIVNIVPDSTNASAFEEAKVYSGANAITNVHADHNIAAGKENTLNPHNLNNTGGQGTFEISWYTALEGNNPQAMLTIVSKNGDSHTHVFVTLDSKVATLPDVVPKPMK